MSEINRKRKLYRRKPNQNPPIILRISANTDECIDSRIFPAINVVAREINTTV
jgi:hypothetical protein